MCKSATATKLIQIPNKSFKTKGFKLQRARASGLKPFHRRGAAQTMCYVYIITYIKLYIKVMCKFSVIYFNFCLKIILNP